MLVLINYEAFQGRSVHKTAAVMDLAWRRIVLDEVSMNVIMRCFELIFSQAHKMNNRAFGFENIRRLEAQYRWCLSGTPMQNKAEN